jgi:hypothetical protein
MMSHKALLSVRLPLQVGAKGLLINQGKLLTARTEGRLTERCVSQTLGQRKSVCL